MRFTDPSGYMAQGCGHSPYWMSTATQIAQGHADWNEQFGWNRGYNAFGINQYLGGGGGSGLSLSDFGLAGISSGQLSLMNNMLASTGINLKTENGQLYFNISWMEGEQIDYRDSEGYIHTTTLQVFAFKRVVVGMGSGEYKSQRGDTDNWLSNLGTAIVLTAQWVFNGEQERTFANDRVAYAFANSRIVEEARKYWYKKANSKLSIAVSVTNFKGESRVGGGNFGFTGLFAAGIDPIEQFVGSTHDLSITSDGKMLTYTITNVTSFESLMYGLTPSWLNFYNTRQTYIFSEPIRFK